MSLFSNRKAHQYQDTQFDNLEIRPAIEADLNSCIELESNLNESRESASAEGFLLTSTDGLEQYSEYMSYGAFWIAEVNQLGVNKFAGFLFALPPESPRMAKLLDIREKFELEVPGVFSLPQLAWLAKVAVPRNFMRNGIADSLYHQLFSTFPNWNLLTTTVAEPIRNLPSEKLQSKHSFKEIGKLPLGKRGGYDNVVCKVHLRYANKSDLQTL